MVAGAWGGGWVWAAGGTGSPAGPVGGGGWTWGGGGVPGGFGGSGSGGGGGLGLGVLCGRRGEGEVDMGRQWRSWWRPGEQERREGGPGGSWWHLREQERREWMVEARWRCGECGRQGRVCCAGGERERRRLRDRDSSLESGQLGGVGGSWGASLGAAWYWGGWGSPVVHGSATQGCGGGSGWWYGSSDCPWRGWARGAPSAWTWWPGGYGSWYGGDGLYGGVGPLR